MSLRHSIACQRLPAAAFVAFAALGLVVAAAPAPKAPSTPATCSVELYFVDQDARTNIRASPSGSSHIRATIDPSTTVAHAIAASNGWFRIDRVDNAEDDATMFRGDGWVHKSVLGLSVASGRHWLRSAPSAASSRLEKLIPDGNMLAPQSCSGEWLQVRVDGKRIGWIDRSTICSNPLTTCS